MSGGVGGGCRNRNVKPRASGSAQRHQVVRPTESPWHLKLCHHQQQKDNIRVRAGAAGQDQAKAAAHRHEAAARTSSGYQCFVPVTSQVQLQQKSKLSPRCEHMERIYLHGQSKVLVVFPSQELCNNPGHASLQDEIILHHTSKTNRR